jgi:hypothetical protein
MSQLIGSVIQLAIAQRAIRIDNGKDVWGVLHLLLKELMDTLAPGKLSLIPARDVLLAQGCRRRRRCRSAQLNLSASH